MHYQQNNFEKSRFSIDDAKAENVNPFPESSIGIKSMKQHRLVDRRKYKPNSRQI